MTQYSMRFVRISSASLVLCFTAFVLSSCSTAVDLPSKWKDREIIVDGIDNEWQQDLHYIEKEKIGVAFKNDGENLYVSMKAIDRETQMKIVRGGMTVWFDSTGGKKKTFGIHFPLGSAGLGGSAPAATHIRGSREDPDASNDNSILEERFSKMLQHIEIIGPGPLSKEQISVSSSLNARGIQVGMRDTMGTLFYELVVPMKMTGTKQLAIGTDTGKVIGVGIITDDMRRSITAGAPDEGAPNGGYGKPGMGGGGSGGGRRGERNGRGEENRGTISPIEFWAKVKIASGY